MPEIFTRLSGFFTLNRGVCALLPDKRCNSHSSINGTLYADGIGLNNFIQKGGMLSRKVLSILCTLTYLLSGAMAADATVITNTYSGWYDANGSHTNVNTNYFSGNNDGTQLNNFFVFDLRGVSGAITGASFKVNSYSISVPGAYTIYATTLEPSIKFNHLGDLAIYNALTSGPAIGSIDVTPENSQQLLDMPLNSAGLSWLQASEGNPIVIGGSFRSTDNGYAYGNSSFTAENNLNINISAAPVPEPGSLALFGAAFFGLAVYTKRRKRA
jgi:hypothetical protein